MRIRFHLRTLFILVATGLMSGTSHNLLADDLDLEQSANDLTSFAFSQDVDEDGADRGAEDKDAEKTSEKEKVNDASSDLDALALIRELNTLRIKRAKYAQNLGPGHPTITDLNEEIREVEAKISKAPEPNDPLTKKVNNVEDMSEKELREAVGMLIERVRDLEYDLIEMKRDVNVIRQRR